jgi:hypothetical protein
VRASSTAIVVRARARAQLGRGPLARLVLGRRLCGLALLAAAIACESPPREAPASTAAGVIYGEDDRQEVYELASSELQTRLARSMVALVPRTSLDAKRLPLNAPILAERARFCSPPRFDQQPTAAFCTGVLLDWDLILTAGHCLRVFALDQLVAVFGYYYRAPDELAVSPNAVFDLAEIVAERLDPVGVEPRLDYAWVRLRYDVPPPLEPLAIRVDPAQDGQALIVAATISGLPLKVDLAARVRDTGAPLFDFFRTDSDTSHGGSGGAALDAQHAVLGILSRGGEDFRTTPSGCVEAVTRPAEAAEEQYTYAAQALDGLCREAGASSSLCRNECGNPCRALRTTASPEASSDDGCSISRGPRQRGGRASFLLLLLVMAGLRRRKW